MIIDETENFLRNLEEATRPNSGSRKLINSILVPEVHKALKDFLSGCDVPFVAIGGLAYSHWGIPRTTQDIDLLFVGSIVPERVPGFKKIRPHAFRHDKTHVEVEVLTPTFLKMSPVLAKKIFQTSVVVEGVNIASPSGIVASKLGRASYQDLADIQNLIRWHEINLDGFGLTKSQLQLFQKIKDETRT